MLGATNRRPGRALDLQKLLAVNFGAGLPRAAAVLPGLKAGVRRPVVTLCRLFADELAVRKPRKGKEGGEGEGDSEELGHLVFSMSGRQF